MFTMNSKGLLKLKRQKQIIHELLQARDKGFVLRIDLELEKTEVKIVYDPDSFMYKNEWSDLNTLDNDMEANINSDLDNLPECKSLLVRFTEVVKQNTILKIANYVSKTYDCKYTLYEGRVDFYDFK